MSGSVSDGSGPAVPARGPRRRSGVSARERDRPRYQRQDSTQTLAEALEEYYAAYPDAVARPEIFPGSIRRLVRNHHLTHVVFGLGTSAADELAVDGFLCLTSGAGDNRAVKYLSHGRQTEKAPARARLGDAVGVWMRVAWRVLRRGRSHRWPWDVPDRFMLRSLKHLRRQYRIHLL